MVKLVIQNSTDEPLIISCKATTEWPTQNQKLPSLEKLDIKPKSCRTVDNVQLTEADTLSSGELYWTLFIRFAPVASVQVASNDDYSNSLFLRFRIHKEITGTSKSYTVMTVPEFNLLPRPKWGTSRKTRFSWSCSGKLYSVVLQRRGWRKIRLDLASTDASTSSLDLIGKALLLAPSSTPTPSNIGVLKEMFENERKNHFLGGANYSKGALCFLDRSCWTDFGGSKALKPELQAPPSPLWDWSGDWRIQVIDGLTDDEGWMYAADWSKEWGAKRSFGKFVRRRLWVRPLRWCPQYNDSGPKREPSIHSKSGVHRTTAKKQLSGAPRLADIVEDGKLAQLPGSALDDLDQDLFFVSLKESLLELLSNLSPDLEALYLDRMSKASQRYRRIGSSSSRATMQTHFVN